MRIRAIVFVACIACVLGATMAQTVVDPSFTVSTYASGLSQPTGFAFIGNNDVFAIEKASGQVRRITGGVVGATALDLNVNGDSERGLLGITLHPDFATNHFVYLYYSATSAAGDSTTESDWTGNRLSRFTYNTVSRLLESETPLLTFARDPAQANGPNHNGGPILFGPDGLLYGVTGELNRNRAEENNTAAATTSSGVGGIYRLTDTGAPAPGNPFAANANSDFHKWYAYGVRNSFGLKFDPVTNVLWDTENGPDSYDEINQVSAGFNSGWNQIMGPDSRDPQSVADLVALPGSAYGDPKFSFFETVAPTDLEFLANFAFDSSYHDAVIFGGGNATNAGRLWLLRLNPARDGFVTSGGLADLVADGESERATIAFGSGFGITTSIQVGPDGALYVMSLENGAIYRIVPEPTGLLPTVAVVGLLLRRGHRRGEVSPR